MSITKAEFDAMARIIEDLLEDHDDGKPEVRYDVEHAPEALPADLWRDALVKTVRDLHAANRAAAFHAAGGAK